jgi:hypothetical protein
MGRRNHPKWSYEQCKKQWERERFSKLSRLQRSILLHLVLPEWSDDCKPRELRDRLIAIHYQGEASASAEAAISRSLSRLNQRDLIVKKRGNWRLADGPALLALEAILKADAAAGRPVGASVQSLPNKRTAP